MVIVPLAIAVRPWSSPEPALATLSVTNESSRTIGSTRTAIRVVRRFDMEEGVLSGKRASLSTFGSWGDLVRWHFACAEGRSRGGLASPDTIVTMATPRKGFRGPTGRSNPLVDHSSIHPAE